MAAVGEEVPADFGPRTADYAFAICSGEKPFAGPPPRTRGAVQVEADAELFGKSQPCLRITWHEGGASVELGPYHPNDVSEYAEAGGAFSFALRGDARPPETFRVVMGDAMGKSAAAGAAQVTELQAGWAKVSVPLSSFAIDWTRWQFIRLEFGPGTSGSINVDDFGIACGE